jgi:hypothetical protein
MCPNVLTFPNGDCVRRVGPKMGKPKGIWMEGVVEAVSFDGCRVQVAAADSMRWRMQSANNFEKLGADAPGFGAGGLSSRRCWLESGASIAKPPHTTFVYYPAEEYHQQYLWEKGGRGERPQSAAKGCTVSRSSL